ncbi:MAG: ribbon-helix-helix protein, CopG family [Nitrospirota bacterium]
MRRTQLYLDEDLWKALQLHSRELGTTVSSLVRQAVRERYLSGAAQRKRIMEAFAGVRKDRPEFESPEAYVRHLRRGTRLSKLSG